MDNIITPFLKFFQEAELIRVILLIIVLLMVVFAKYGFSQFMTLYYKIQAYVRTKKIKKFLDGSIETHDSINILLDSALERVSGDRAMCFQYHNGGYNLDGVAFTKTSSTNDRCRDGFVIKADPYQNIPLSLFVYWVKRLSHNKFRAFGIRHLEEIKTQDIGVYTWLSSQNIKSIYAAGINTPYGTPIGFIFVLFYQNDKVLTKDELRILDDVATSIGAIACKMKK